MLPTRNALSNWKRLAPRYVTLGLVSAGWLLSLALLLRVPLFAGVIGAGLAVLGLFVLPGFGWLALSGYGPAWPLPARAALAFVAGLTPYSLLSLAALALSYPAQGHPAAILLGGQVVQTALLVLLWRQGRREAEQPHPPLEPEAGLIGLALAAGVVALLALWLTLTVSAYLPLGPQDAWDYANLAQWTADHPAVPPPQPPGLRFLLNTWINLTAVLAWGTGLPAVDLLMRFLPGVLLALSLSATYALAFEVSGRRRVALGAVVVQTMMALTYVGSNALLGVFATLRLSEDKALLAFVLLPAALAWLVRWLDERRWPAALWLAAAAGVAVLTHPVALALLGVTGGAYFLLTFAHRPDWALLRRYGPFVAALGVPLLLLGALIGSGEGGLSLGARLTASTLVNDFAFQANQLLVIGPLEHNQYIVHPGMVHPFMHGALAVAVLALLRWRNKTARYLIAAMLVPAALLFTPFLTPLLGQIVTLSMLERFLWLWPVGLAWGAALEVALTWLAARLAARLGRWQTVAGRLAPRKIAPRRIVPGLLALALIALSVPAIERNWAYHFWFGSTQNLRPAEVEVRDALAGLAAESESGLIHVAPPDRLLPVLVGYTPQVITHTLHRLEGLPIVELIETTWINNTHLEKLQQDGIGYVVVERSAPAAWHLFLRPDRFTPVFEGSGYLIFRYDGLSTTALDALLFTLTGLAGSETPSDDPAWARLRADLESQAAEPGAPPVVSQALGWLANRSGDYERAAAHFAATYERAPEATPLFAVPYVDALIARQDFDQAGRVALALWPLAGPHDVDLAARLGDLARRLGPEAPPLAALYERALAPQTGFLLRRAILDELLTTDLIRDLSEAELDALLAAWEGAPAGGRPGAATVADNLIARRRDPARGARWLENAPENERDLWYWLTRAGVALFDGDPEAARAALAQAEAVNDYRLPDWYVAFFAGHLAAASGDEEAALAAYEDAYARSPGGQAPRLFLADAYARQGRWEEAIALYETMAASPGPESYWGSYGLARLYDQRGETALADAAYAQGLARQALYSPDLSSPPRHALPTVQNPLPLAAGGQLLYGGVSLLRAETLTRTLEPGQEAIFRVCYTALPANSDIPFWQVQIVEPLAPQLLGQTRAWFPVADPLSVICWPVTVPVNEFERPDPPVPARLEIVSLTSARLDPPLPLGWAMMAAPPAVPAPSAEPLASFGGLFILLGAAWETPAPGEPFAVRLTWQAEAAPTQDYVFFVHLLDETGAFVAQRDQQPYDGQYPTSAWEAGARVTLTHVLDLPDTLSARPLHLWVGIYEARSRDRLPGVGADGAALQNGLLPLATLTP